MNPGTSSRPAASVTGRLGREPLAPGVADSARGDPVAVEAHPRVGNGVEPADEPGGVDDDGGSSSLGNDNVVAAVGEARALLARRRRRR